MGSPEDNILAKEIDSWKGFEYALRQPNATLFNNANRMFRKRGICCRPLNPKDHRILRSRCLWL